MCIPYCVVLSILSAYTIVNDLSLTVIQEKLQIRVTSLPVKVNFIYYAIHGIVKIFLFVG